MPNRVASASNNPHVEVDVDGSPVGSAVRTLNSLSDFSNGNFDSYTVSDTLLSEAGRDKDKVDGSGYNPESTAPLMDFKSAFSDIENKQTDLSFLHETLTMSSDAEMHQVKQHNSPHPGGLVNGHGGRANGGHAPAGQHPVDLNPMDFIEHDVVSPVSGGHPGHGPSGTGPPTGFDLGDTFDMLNEFPDLGYQPGGGSNPLLTPPNNPGPMLGSSPGGSKRGNNNGYLDGRGELVQITEFNPEWSWSEVGSIRFGFIRPQAGR